MIAGNLQEETLESQFRNRISPAYAAILKTYSVAKPIHPITVILCHDEQVYFNVSRQLFGLSEISNYGYYRPTERSLVVNQTAGDSPLPHELTHALFAADWPEMPLWLNEGIASLNETCEFSASQPHIRPLDNWRLPIAQKSLETGHSATLRQLLSSTDFTHDPNGENYARARYFTFYLHDQGVLPELVSSLRQATRASKNELAVADQLSHIRRVLHGATNEETWLDFTTWLKTRDL